jgi:hypothetical protein
MVWFCVAFSGRGSQLDRVMDCAHWEPVGSAAQEPTGRVEKYPSVLGGAPFCVPGSALDGVVDAGAELDVDAVAEAPVPVGDVGPPVEVALAVGVGLAVRVD